VRRRCLNTHDEVKTIETRTSGRGAMNSSTPADRTAGQSEHASGCTSVIGFNGRGTCKQSLPWAQDLTRQHGTAARPQRVP